MGQSHCTNSKFSDLRMSCQQTVGGVCDLLVVVDNALYHDMGRDESVIRANVGRIVEEADAIIR